MINYSDGNFFSYTKNSFYIYLIDKNCNISGNTLKENIFRTPNEIANVKKQIDQKKEIKIGNCFLTTLGLYIVMRDSFRSQWCKESFEVVWKALVPQLIQLNKHYHINIEDYPWIEPILKRYDEQKLDLTIYNHCEWEWN